MRVRKTVLAMLSVLGIAAASQALAQEKSVVVELYTSQGCSSCPPADGLLEKLTEYDDIIALALHVDYWDYIGWKDTFADPAYSERQRGYARAAGARSVFTPQMVIGGIDHVVGYKPMQVADTLQAHRSVPDGVDLTAQLSGNSIIISVDDATRRQAMVVSVVGYMDAQTVQIGRGENAGRTITYHNVVSDWNDVAEWDGRSALRLREPMPEGDGAVVLVQEAKHGAILAATRITR